ncbi:MULTISPECIES: winged helix-turn-helix transcriptional regulator [unclassified Chryseobacterium]|nr:MULTISPECIES: winged helix-turn-helix transcriptional regulator [unclassified Chryseobacterium]
MDEFKIKTRIRVKKKLKNMEENDIVTRTAFATAQPAVEYNLTAKGRKLEPIFFLPAQKFVF